MSLKVRKALKPIKDEFKGASSHEKQEILMKVKLANKIIAEDIKKGKYDDNMKEKIKRESKPFRDLQEELEKEM